MELGKIGADSVSKSMESAASKGSDIMGGLGKTDFMKLLITQLRYQNPMEPTGDKEFIAQLAQFSTLEQMENLNAGMAMLMRFQELSQAGSLLGKVVEATDSLGETFKGAVKEVRVTNQGLKLNIDGKEVPLGNVVRILLEEAK